ncbi:hypothetical protein [Xylella fastidiosa]|nr:hypothetical protein [Xylella fastidiosa]UIX80205.1 hypothetical protein LZ756_06685 [Xylella fastidiosa subsp. sandyi]
MTRTHNMEYPMHNSFCFCGVLLPDLVYAKLKSKEELERFPFTERGRDWTPERSETVLAHDSVEYQHRFHVKSLEMKDGDNTKPFEGIFLWFKYFVAEPLVGLRVQVLPT